MTRLAGLVATFFGVGLLPKAPGTWGSLVALLLGAGLAYTAGFYGLLAAALVASLLGVWASDLHAKTSGKDDPGEIVIDEVAGMWIALIPLPLDPLAYLMAFVLFRLFDIWKPGPIGYLDRRLHGGLGIMADDILAGLIAAALGWAIWSFV